MDNLKIIDVASIPPETGLKIGQCEIKIRKMPRVDDTGDNEDSIFPDEKPKHPKIDLIPETVALCHECGRSLPQSKIDWHLQLHKRTRFLCSLCLSTFKKLNLLTQHKIRCSQKNGDVNSFPDWFDLSRAHDNIFPCPLCPEEYENLRLLLDHMSVHDIATVTFTCGPCMKVFYHMAELKKHMFIHVLEDQKETAAKEGEIPEKSVKSSDELSA